ncbi:hypothetical protein ACX0HA_07620 [Flavobacterium hauense]
MKKLITVSLLFLLTQNSSAQESKIQLPENQEYVTIVKADSLSKTKKTIWLGSKVHVEPLYVIDGVPSNANSLKKIKTENIVDIFVIKNAEAISAYGKRGENGVIIVKTKNGLTKKEKRKLRREAKNQEKKKTN